MYAELQIMGFGGGGVCGSGVLPPFEPSPYFESIWPIENNFESSPQTLSWVETFLFTIGPIGLRGAMRAIASSMSPNVYNQQGPTPTFFTANLGSIIQQRHHRQIYFRC
jgi:hypothetical protein